MHPSMPGTVRDLGACYPVRAGGWLRTKANRLQMRRRLRRFDCEPRGGAASCETVMGMTVDFERTKPSDYLTRLAASDLGRAYKALVVQEMAIELGHTVIDLGCGPGADLRAFAESVGPSGAVIGLDNDDEAVERARHAIDDLPNVDVRTGDIQQLDVPSGSINRTHTDRVLQHVGDPARALAEVHRVLSPGGLAIFAEPDWDTLVIDFPRPAVAVAYRRFITDRVVRNSRIGRQLPRLADAAGLIVTRIVPVTAVFRDAHEADKILGSTALRIVPWPPSTSLRPTPKSGLPTSPHRRSSRRRPCRRRRAASIEGFGSRKHNDDCGRAEPDATPTSMRTPGRPVGDGLYAGHGADVY